MKISVYITSYNQKDYLKEAVKSVLNQTLLPFEIIIVDDCSDDGSQELIINFAKKYDIIKYFFHERNLGVSQVRITALSNVQGDYVTYLDGDDLYLPNKLKIEANLIKSNNCDLAFTNNMYVDSDDISDVKWIWAQDIIDLDTNLFIKTLTRDFPRKSLFRMELVNYKTLKNVGFHDKNLKIYEDYDLRIRLSKKVKMVCSIEPTTKIRISKNGLSRLKKEEHIRAFKYIYNKYLYDIQALELPLRSFVEEKLRVNLKEIENVEIPKVTTTLKMKIKRKLKLIIDRI